VASAKTAALIDSDGSLAQMFPVTRQVFTDHQRRALLRTGATASAQQPDPYVTLLQEAERRHSGAGLMDFVSYAEARTYMHDVLLRDTDQMTMAHGLEARVPLLDHRVIEYVVSLPEALKTPGDVPKHLLVRSLDGALPEDCVQRPKQGFVLPFEQWMRGELRSFCEQRLFGPRGLVRHELFDAKAVTSLWASFLATDRTTTWSRPWTLVALSDWLDLNEVSA
jgi:asparagine synthase (glutamine-hydrolysing)